MRRCPRGRRRDTGAQRLLSLSSIECLMAREYFGLVGALSATARGRGLLDRHHFFPLLAALCALPGRSDLALLILQTLSYAGLPTAGAPGGAALWSDVPAGAGAPHSSSPTDGGGAAAAAARLGSAKPAREVLEYCCTEAAAAEVRLAGVRHLSLLATARLEGFGEWGIELLRNTTFDADPAVRHEGLLGLPSHVRVPRPPRPPCPDVCGRVPHAGAHHARRPVGGTAPRRRRRRRGGVRGHGARARLARARRHRGGGAADVDTHHHPDGGSGLREPSAVGGGCVPAHRGGGRSCRATGRGRRAAPARGATLGDVGRIHAHPEAGLAQRRRRRPHTIGMAEPRAAAVARPLGCGRCRGRRPGNGGASGSSGNPRRLLRRLLRRSGRRFHPWRQGGCLHTRPGGRTGARHPRKERWRGRRRRRRRLAGCGGAALRAVTSGGGRHGQRVGRRGVVCVWRTAAAPSIWRSRADDARPRGSAQQRGTRESPRLDQRRRRGRHRRRRRRWRRRHYGGGDAGGGGGDAGVVAAARPAAATGARRALGSGPYWGAGGGLRLAPSGPAAPLPLVEQVDAIARGAPSLSLRGTAVSVLGLLGGSRTPSRS